MRLNHGMALLALALAACSQHASVPAAATAASTEAAAIHPESGLPVIGLTVTQGTNVRHFRVEVARTAPEQAKGLMFRRTMGADEGMLFPMNPPRFASFWMRNTVLPLDIIFIGEDRRILNIAANARPYDETPLMSNGKVRAVLELNGDRAAQLGIGPGDVVAWQAND